MGRSGMHDLNRQLGMKPGLDWFHFSNRLFRDGFFLICHLLSHGHHILFSIAAFRG